MPLPLQLVALNVERSKHLDRVAAFLRSTQADVVCLQELMEPDAALFEEASGGTCFFAPMALHEENGRITSRGVGILSRLPVKSRSLHHYGGSESPQVRFDATTQESKHKTSAYVLALCEVEKEGTVFRIATTHFAWAPGGEADDFQRKDIQKLLAILAQSGELVLCGDFNAPRGGEIFGLLAQKYKDNVPQKYTTSIDGILHRAGPLPFMVDGLFSTPGYTVSHVEMVCGISDHCALIANVASSS